MVLLHPGIPSQEGGGRLNVVSSMILRAGDLFKPVVTGRTGRNDFCPSGRGKKFKKCCLQ